MLAAFNVHHSLLGAIYCRGEILEVGKDAGGGSGAAGRGSQLGGQAAQQAQKEVAGGEGQKAGSKTALEFETLPRRVPAASAEEITKVAQPQQVRRKMGLYSLERFEQKVANFDANVCRQHHHQAGGQSG